MVKDSIWKIAKKLSTWAGMAGKRRGDGNTSKMIYTSDSKGSRFLGTKEYTIGGEKELPIFISNITLSPPG